MDTGNEETEEKEKVMKATVLIDNTASGRLAGEWGLSFYIEYRGMKLLLDAGGASGLFAQNAFELGIKAVSSGILW